MVLLHLTSAFLRFLGFCTAPGAASGDPFAAPPPSCGSEGEPERFKCDATYVSTRLACVMVVFFALAW